MQRNRFSFLDLVLSRLFCSLPHGKDVGELALFARRNTTDRENKRTTTTKKTNNRKKGGSRMRGAAAPSAGETYGEGEEEEKGSYAGEVEREEL